MEIITEIILLHHRVGSIYKIQPESHVKYSSRIIQLLLQLRYQGLRIHHHRMRHKCRQLLALLLNRPQNVHDYQYQGLYILTTAMQTQQLYEFQHIPTERRLWHHKVSWRLQRWRKIRCDDDYDDELCQCCDGNSIIVRIMLILGGELWGYISKTACHLFLNVYSLAVIEGTVV